MAGQELSYSRLGRLLPTPGRFLVLLTGMELILLLSERFQWFGFNEKKGWPVLIAIACVGMTIVLIFLWFVLAFLFQEICSQVPEVAFFGYGDVQQDKDGFVLSFTFQHERPPSSIDGGVLHPVRWGERWYLIAENDLLNFCNSVNSGEEADPDGYSQFLLREGKRLEVHGLPSVPDKYRQYLLPRPLEAKVINVEELADSPKSDDVSSWPAMTIDIGEKDGLRKGMHLYIRDIDYFVSRVVVSELHDNKCQVRFSPAYEVLKRRIPKPKIGWRISSLSKFGER